MISYISYLLKYNEIEDRYNKMLRGYVANHVCKFLFSIDKKGNQIYQNRESFIELSSKLISKYNFIKEVFSTNKLELESVNFVGEVFYNKFISLLKEAMDDPEYYYFMNIYRYDDDFETKLNRYNKSNLINILEK